MNAPKSSVRDGWGLLLNAIAHLRVRNTNDCQAAIAELERVRIQNLESFAKQWVRGSYQVVGKE